MLFDLSIEMLSTFFFSLEMLLEIFFVLAALNATNAVKRIHTRLQPEESTESLNSAYVVGQVLNARKQKQLLNKGSVSYIYKNVTAILMP